MKLTRGANFKISRRVINLYTRFSSIVTIATVVLLALLGYVTLLGPKWDEIRSVGLNDYAREQRRLEADKEYLAELAKLVAKYNAINQATVQQIEQIVPTDEQLPALFVQMEALAADAGMQLDSLTVTTTAAESIPTSSALKTLNLEMQISGGARYSDVKVLLDTIEKSQRLLDVVSVSFTLEGTEIVSIEGGEGGVYVLSLRSYYLQSPDEAATSPDQATEFQNFLQNVNAQ